MRHLMFIAAVLLPFSAAAEPRYTIAFASFAPLDSDIFIAARDGSDARPFLPHPAQDYNASFSEDGAWIVFTSERDGSADIYRARADGSGLEALVTHPAFDDQAALSPDGRRLVFVSNRGGDADVWLMDLGSKALRNLSKHPDADLRPSWSPDGGWITFTTERHSAKARFGFGVPIHSTEIYRVRPDGTGLQRMTEDVAYEGSPVWSPDGRRLAIYRAEPEEVLKATSPMRETTGTFQIVIVDVATGRQEVVTTGAGEKWSPRWLSSRELGYVSRRGVEFRSGEPGEAGEFRNPDWSRDGRRMVFQRSTGSEWPPLQRWHSKDPGFELIRTGIFPAFSPRDDRLLVNDARAGALQNRIVIMNGDGSGRSVLFADPTRNALAPVWSHSGDRIAFGLGGFFQMLPRVPRASADIAVISTHGTNLQLLTDGQTNVAFPSWSPDDRQLVFRSFQPPGLFTLDVATRTKTRLLEGPHNFPAWSPDGSVIAFVSSRDGNPEIYTVRPDGTGLTRLTQNPGVDGHLSWSPDGKWIAFASDRAGFRDEWALHLANGQAGGDIYVMRADGSDLRQLTDDQFEDGTPAWKPWRDAAAAAR